MFTLSHEVDKEGYLDVTLKFENDDTIVTFTPEDCRANLKEEGDVWFTTTNGCCYFSHQGNTFEFSVAKFGGGDGGQLTITIKLSPIEKESFVCCLKKWKILLANTK